MSQEATNPKKPLNAAFSYRFTAFTFVAAAVTFALTQQNWAIALPFFVLAITFFILGEEEENKQDKTSKGEGQDMDND